MIFTLMFLSSFYVPQTAWIRYFMKQHSQFLGDNWNEYPIPKYDNEIFVKYPKYFKKPLHGFENGGICRYQAIYQSPSMRYIMRIFQDDPFYREHIMKEKLHSIESFLPSKPTILDIGCGTGDSTWAIRESIEYANIVGIDLSPYMIDVAKLQYDIEFIHANAAYMPFANDTFDVITSFALFHEMPKRYSIKVLTECLRVLKPGGYLLIWDQKITPESATTQQCKGAPSIEPFLASYITLNITEWMDTNNFIHVVSSSDKLMQSWSGIKCH